MNKTAIKNYAIWARVNLIDAVKQKAYQYEITKDNITDASADVVSGKPLTKDEKEQRRQLIDQINRKGFDQVMEEVAYTWFNRFIALRFMEVNGYLPTKIRVFTDSEGNFKPEILKEALTVELPVDKSRVMELLEKQDNEELYKMLLIAQCNELSNGLPDMFEVISNYTELLFPNNLLKEDSILGEMVNTIPEEDWTDAVQIIGWLYQYYNSELKDETFALLKKNVKISKERIPAATQLFTPDWIVRYMVENSLGRLWYEGHPNGEIKKEWKYYLDEAQQEPEVEEQLKAIREEYKTIKPEDIKVIDPCMGSGHILVYAFDVLMQIYTSAGWSERDAAESILENNLFGLDIDDRAGQLAYFAVMMKARKYSRRILTKNIRPKVFSIQESNNVKIEAWWLLGPEEDIARRLVQDLIDAKEYGSILKLSVDLEELQALRRRLDDVYEMSDKGNLIDMAQSDEITRQLYSLVKLAEIMVQKYDVVVTNPPYMGSSGMSEKLSEYVRDNYPKTKYDMSTVFMERTIGMCSLHGTIAMINIPVWMFLSSFEKMRNDLLKNHMIICMAHFGRGIFGSDFGTTSFVINRDKVENFRGSYMKLYQRQGEVESLDEKERKFLSKSDIYFKNQENFLKLPGAQIAYWIPQQVYRAFFAEDERKLRFYTKSGLTTGDNDRFLKLWHEIDYVHLYYDKQDDHILPAWYPHLKGGEFRKWYGDYDYVIHYDPKSLDDMVKCPGFRHDGKEYFFAKSATWSKTTAGPISARINYSNTTFNTAGCCLFAEGNEEYALAALNSKVGALVFSFLCPSLSYAPGDVAKFPILVSTQESEIKGIVTQCIDESKSDWNSYETSWDFKSHPLI